MSGRDGVVFALVGEGLVVECLHHDLELLFKQLAVGVAVDHRGAKGLHLAGVVAPADAEDDPAAGENVHHGEVLGEPDRVPHGKDVEAAAELDAVGVLRQVLAHDEQVGNALVPLPLEVVLGHPQDVEPQVVEEHRRCRAMSMAMESRSLSYQRSLAGMPSKPMPSPSSTWPA